MALKQPMTAKQIVKWSDNTLDGCSHLLHILTKKGLVYCLNPRSRNSRLYWITNLGKSCRRQIQQAQSIAIGKYDFPSVNWEIYGWVCYSHRATIIKTLTEPMQPAQIKRKARLQNPHLRMSANNTRDVIRLFLKKGIVRPVKIRKKAHLRYELSDQGKKMQELLVKAENCSW